MKRRGHSSSCFLKSEYKGVTLPHAAQLSGSRAACAPHAGCLRWGSFSQKGFICLVGSRAASGETLESPRWEQARTGGRAPEGQPLRAQLPAPTCVRGRALGPRSPRRRLPGRQQQRQQQQRPRHPPPPSPLGSRSHLGGAGAALSAGRKEAAGVGAPDGHVRAGTGPPPAPRGVPAPGSLRALPLRRSREPLTGPPAPSACPGASSQAPSGADGYRCQAVTASLSTSSSPFEEMEG